MTNAIFVLLGSNEGDPFANLITARECIRKDGAAIVRSSSLYKTAAWGMKEQPDFINQVLEISSTHPPHALLERLLLIEQRMGRVRRHKWGPRLIDIDLLLYRQEIVNSATLVIPHPGIIHRRFTLAPLAEIAPDLVHPVLKKTISELLDACADNSPVTRMSAYPE